MAVVHLVAEHLKDHCCCGIDELVVFIDATATVEIYTAALVKVSRCKLTK